MSKLTKYEGTKQNQEFCKQQCYLTFPRRCAVAPLGKVTLLFAELLILFCTVQYYADVLKLLCI